MFDGHVLIAPGHRVLDDGTYGSEVGWAEAIITGLPAFCTRVTAVVGATRHKSAIPSNLHVVEVDRQSNLFETGLADVARFTWRYSSKARSILTREDPSLLHHLLPFRIERSVNPLAFGLRRIPFIIGPVQVPVKTSNDVTWLPWADNSKNAANNAEREIDFLSHVLRRLNTAMLLRSSAVVAISQGAAALLSRYIPDERIRVIPVGVDQRRFPPVPVRIEHDNALRLLAVSYFQKRKRLPVIVDAVARARARGANVTLTILGEGPERSALESTIEQVNAAAYVRLAGFVPNSRVHETIVEHDVLVAMSESESFGMNLVEAMSMRRPVISAPNEGARDILASGEGGILLKTGSVTELENAIMVLAHDRRVLHEMAERARDTVERRYTWAKVCESYADLYSHVHCCTLQSRRF